MKGWIKFAPVAALAFAAACAEMPKEVPAGVYGEGGYSVTLERAWTQMPERFGGTSASFLTYDGPQLNQVHLMTIAAGEGILKEPRTEDQTIPTFRAGMTSLELVELVTQSVTSFGLQNVTAANVRPATLASSEGVGFDFTAVTGSGLRMKGSAIAAEANGALDLMLYLAPEMHYYDAYLPEVERIFTSASRPAP